MKAMSMNKSNNKITIMFKFNKTTVHKQKTNITKQFMRPKMKRGENIETVTSFSG